MNGQTSTSTPTMTSEMIERVSAAYADGDSTLVARVRAVRAVLNAGITVKGMHDSMTRAAALDPNITVVSTTIYGYAAAAASLADSIDGLPFSKVPAADLALFARAAKHVGVGAFKAGARNTLASLSDEIGGQERLIALRDMCAVALSTVRADVAKAAAKSRAVAEREARPNDGAGEDIAAADVPNLEHRHPVSPEAKALAAIRDAVHYLTHGGEYSADLASATAELTAALTAARKRTRSTIAA
ncbi:hypothetical protein SEA_SADLAD_103 [Microbacterium phage SadLad]|nr:hypothetical protein SEA_SADLAD_103 [Microbacterium phage SadLad]